MELERDGWKENERNRKSLVDFFGRHAQELGLCHLHVTINK